MEFLKDYWYAILFFGFILIAKMGFFEKEDHLMKGYDPNKNYKSSNEDIWPDSDCDEIWNYSDCIDNGCFWENTGDGDGFCMPSGIFN